MGAAMAQHRDHLHAARVASAAFDLSGVAAKLYFKAHGRAYWERLIRVAASVGIHRDMPTGLDDVDRRITTTIDTRAVVDRKRAALHCHASQLDSSSWEAWQCSASQLDSSIAGRLLAAEFAEAFGVEDFIRARDTTGSPAPETDLFAGLG